MDRVNLPPIKPWPSSGTVIATALCEIIQANQNPIGDGGIMQGVVQSLDVYGIGLVFIQNLAEKVRALPDEQAQAVFLMLRGQTDKEICETLGITKMTYWRWRQPGGGLYPIFQAIAESGFMSCHYCTPAMPEESKIVPSLRPKKPTGRIRRQKAGHHPESLPE